MKTGRRKFLNVIFHLMLAIELAVFQFAWPLAVARAEMPSGGETAGEQTVQEESDNPDDNSGNSEDTGTEEETNKEESSEEQEKPEDLWKTCDLDDLFDKFEDEKDCEECKEKTSCEKIEVCLEEKIEIENDTDIANDVETSANTGGNEIELAEPRPERSSEDRLQEREERETRDNSSAEELDSDTAQENAAASDDRNTSDANENSGEPAEDEQQNDDENAASEENPEESGSAEIETGEAVAVSDVVNVVNTNVIGDNGIETVENIYGDYEGDINLLDSFNALLENADDMNEDNENTFGAVEISIENEADIDNDVVTTANTGDNEIDNENENGASEITTGDAIAVANVVNVVNTNIIGNNFLFAVINIFGNWVGDLIVPGEGLLTTPQTGQPANFIVDAENDTNIENDIETSASSGQNGIEAEGGAASVETGDAYADSIVVNEVGSTVVANNWFFLAINNMGNWVGNVLNWNEENGTYDTVFSFDFDEEEDPEEGGIESWLTKIFIRNEADIENNIETTANTGENAIESEGGDASITTGNAYAFSKVYNLVNNNFIGNNWMFAVVNIFGSWQGDVEFAYPDLSVALSDSVSKVKKSDNYSYNITYKNNGHADCANVKVGITLPDSVDYESDTSGSDPDRDGNDYYWTISGLKSGEEKTFQVGVSVSDDLPDGISSLESQAVVATETKEIELQNNFASDKTDVYYPGSGDDDGEDDDGGVPGSEVQLNSKLVMSRSVSEKKIKVGQITKHTLTVENTGQTTVKDIEINDKVRNKDGSAGDYTWKVEKLEPGKRATIKYKLMVNPDAPTGSYRNNAVAWGYDEGENEVRSNEAGIKIAVGELGTMEGENYYYTYYTYYYPSSSAVTMMDDDSSLIPTAEAAGETPGDGRVLGEWSNGICHGLPWWGWIFAGIVYLTVVHWSLLRQKKIISPVKL